MKTLGAKSLLRFVIAFSFLRTAARNRKIRDGLLGFSRIQTTGFWVWLVAFPVLGTVLIVAGHLRHRVGLLEALLLYLPVGWPVSSYVSRVADQDSSGVGEEVSRLAPRQQVILRLVLFLALLAYLGVAVTYALYAKDFYRRSF